MSRAFACVLNTRGCPQQVFIALPRSSILCGCISISLAGKLMRYGVDTLPHVRCMKKKAWSLLIGGLVDKISPAFELIEKLGCAGSRDACLSRTCGSS
jgi:hypothetical protein